MSDASEPQHHSEPDEGPNRIGLAISVAIVGLCAVLWMVRRGSAPNFTLDLLFLISQVCVVSVVVWQACDPFADAAQWIGETFRLPGSVRGATLDAIASSMPELFSGIFFVVLAIQHRTDDGPAALTEAGAEGFGSTIATCAGSAVYNMILIPAFCALVISYTRRERPTIDVEEEVVSRDGMWFVCCEVLLIVFLFQNTMYWWMGLILVLLYFVYIGQLYRDAMSYRKKMATLREYFRERTEPVAPAEVIETMHDRRIRVSRALVLQAKEQIVAERAGELNEESADDEAPESAGVFFGFFEVQLTRVSVWVVIGIATLVAAAACYFLVDATRGAAELLGVPAFFVAVIVAAAASSVPDTFLAIGAAKRGDDSGAVSNAFGSNIFDICICLSVPLFVNSYLTGWQPVSLLQDGEPIAGLVGLRILLVVLTVITLAIMWQNKQLTRAKAWTLVGLYGVFIGYAVLGSLGMI